MGRMRRIADTPVIFLSAHGRQEVIPRAFEAGAVDYVVKPFASAELMARVRNALRRRLAPLPAEPSGPFTLGERLRTKLEDDAVSPRYIFAEPRVGYRMAAGEAQREETATE